MLPLIAVLNGPNLNMLGSREPALYGAATLEDVEALCAETATALELAIDFRQTNHEGELITWVQECRDRARGIVINPGGYSHTSVALMDAVLAAELPTVEVHLTNIHAREEFRRHSLVLARSQWRDLRAGHARLWAGVDRDLRAASGRGSMSIIPARAGCA